MPCGCNKKTQYQITYQDGSPSETVASIAVAQQKLRDARRKGIQASYSPVKK
jgi:hypothetical protein